MAAENIVRFIELPQDHSFFLFGPRGSGKTTLIKERFKDQVLFIDLLDQELERQLSSSHNDLINMVKAHKDEIQYVVIDEVQKIPKLLDLVHMLIESTNKKFILTGSLVFMYVITSNRIHD